MNGSPFNDSLSFGMFFCLFWFKHKVQRVSPCVLNVPGVKCVTGVRIVMWAVVKTLFKSGQCDTVKEIAKWTACRTVKVVCGWHEESLMKCHCSPCNLPWLTSLKCSLAYSHIYRTMYICYPVSNSTILVLLQTVLNFTILWNYTKHKCLT